MMSANDFKIRKNTDKIEKYKISGLSKKEIDFNIRRLNNEIKHLEVKSSINF